jgi:hypothetical protein
MASKELIGKLGLDTTAFDKSLSESLGKLKSFGAEMTKTGKKLSTAVTLPILAIGTASVMAASDAEETASKFNTIFRDISGDAERSFGVLRNEYGLSSTAARQLLGDTGDLLTGFGFSQSAALELSEEVNKLAVDLASFTNFSGGAKGASAALTKALLGERESVKALGISILEEDVKKQMAINTAKGLVFETERQAKAQATLDIAISQSQNAIGDYSRTSGSFANQLRLLQARTHDLMVEFGEILLPVVSKLLGAVQGVVNWFTQLDGTTKKIIVIVGGLAAAIGPVLVGLGFLASTIIPAMIAGFAALFSPVTLVIAAVAALAAAALYVADNWDVLKERISNFGVIFKNAIIDLVQFLLKNNPIQLLIKPYEYLLGLLGVELPNPFELISDSLDQFRGEVKENTKQFGSFGQAVKNAFTGAKKDIEGVDKAEENLITTTGTLVTTTDSLGGAFRRVFNTVAIEGKTALEALGTTALTTADQLRAPIFAMEELDGTTRKFNERQAFMTEVLQGTHGAMEGLFNTMLNGGNAFQFIFQMLKQLVARLLAAVAVAALLSILIPGGGAIGGAASGLAGGASKFLDIFKNVAGLPTFAEGGMVTGQTMAMVGDNPSGKEAIIPFEKMGSFINMATGGMAGGNIKVEVTGRVTGEDIILAGNNFTNSKTRRLGF